MMEEKLVTVTLPEESWIFIALGLKDCADKLEYIEDPNITPEDKHQMVEENKMLADEIERQIYEGVK